MRFRKWYIILILVLIVLIFTNPSIKSFRRYVNPAGNEANVYPGRKSNFILFSTFEVNTGIYERRYIGVFNFFILTKTELRFL